MAGNLSGFDAEGFRTAIRFAMNLGAPPDAEQQATFVFPRTAVATGPEDPTGVPFGPNVTISRQPAKTVKVPCSIEKGLGTDVQTDVGRFTTDHLTVTLLDQDYAQVVGFEFLVLGGEQYRYVKELPPLGLGSVGVHQILVRAEASR